MTVFGDVCAAGIVVEGEVGELTAEESVESVVVEGGVEESETGLLGAIAMLDGALVSEGLWMLEGTVNVDERAVAVSTPGAILLLVSTMVAVMVGWVSGSAPATPEHMLYIFANWSAVMSEHSEITHWNAASPKVSPDALLSAHRQLRS